MDAVVRDKKGRLVSGLGPEDFEVFDNGESRQIDSFRLVQGSEAITAGSSKKNELDPLGRIRLITMIFQSTSLDAQKLSREAALGLLSKGLPQNVYVSVMAIDHQLEVLQAFTNDMPLLKKAIERGTTRPSTDFTADTERLKEQLSTAPQVLYRQFGLGR